MSTFSSVGPSPSLLNILDIGKQSRGAAIGLLFYDHILCLDREIRFVWTRDKTRPAFWLYLFNRVFAFAYYVFDTIPLTPSGEVASKICLIYLMCDAIVTTVSTLTVQVVLQLRIYALYDRSRNILITLIVLCALEVATMAILIGVTMGHLEGVPILSTSTGCAYQGLLGASSLFWIPGLVFEPVLLALVAWKAWGWNGDSIPIPLVRRIARGSLFYFIAVYAQLLLNTVIWARAPQYINIFNPWSAVLPSLLGSRIMLDMREAVCEQGSASYLLETFSEPVWRTAVDSEADRDDTR